jgi:hypothetical protein
MEIVNLFTVECSDEMEHEGFRIRETQIGPRLGADLVGAACTRSTPARSSGRTTSITRTRNG